MPSPIVLLAPFLMLPGLLPGMVLAQPDCLDLSEHYPEVVAEVVRIQADSEGETLGSGFFYRGEGRGNGPDEGTWVVSNAHVVAGRDTVQLKAQDGRRWEAQVLDRNERLDLAVLTVEAGPSSGGLRFREQTARVGEPVWAVGSPFGLAASLTSGHLAAEGRYFTAEPSIPYLQIDMSLNPGGSGGPLLDGNGRVVGINTQVVGRGEGQAGLAFAIPAWVVRRYVSGLEANGGEAGYLGVGLVAGGGALVVSRVIPDSPAERAGIQPGDQLSGQKVVDGPQGYLRHRLLKPLAGEIIALVREGRDGEVEGLFLEAEPFSRTNRQIDWLAMEARRHVEGGVEVVALDEPDSRLSVGDRILRQGSRSVDHPFDLTRPSTRSAPLLVEREDQRFFVAIRVLENER
ncbi:S1-C subfamily serine protease [Natronospira proteinivora]|uniref:S1-C subfamily serine protease n=1 Tax=Natronospira proteinivora TaxID=1807133 RepID=A0ABT1G6F4_9GAMM|nr:trypsin-like peptidase domain-containing protein [Natronospira proteinivora]MCP1726672.1 S1-C subfamily serine protease [Natronospira proteinivora]